MFRLPDAAGARLNVIADQQRTQLADASQLSESLRLAYHAELIGWTSHFESNDGIPRRSLVSAAENDRVDIGRDIPVTQHRERRLEIGEEQAKVEVLSM